MGPGYERELAVAIAAVRQAAELCRAVRSSIDPGSVSKKDKSPVTVADFGSQALICRALALAFPGDRVVAEEDSAALNEAENSAVAAQVLHQVRRLCPEAGEQEVRAWIDRGGSHEGGGRFWTIDPIDGTKGFLRNEQYAIALALVVEGRPVVAALGCPNLDGGTLFSAVHGRGATLRPMMDLATEPVPICVSTTSDAAAGRFCESVESGHSSHGEAAAVAQTLGITAPPIRMDSQCKYGVVARGEADIYLRLPTRAGYIERIWDHAAGALIVLEAGGRVTDIAGKPLEFHHGRGLEANRGVIASNGRLQDRVLAALAQVGVV